MSKLLISKSCNKQPTTRICIVWTRMLLKDECVVGKEGRQSRKVCQLKATQAPVEVESKCVITAYIFVELWKLF